MTDQTNTPEGVNTPALSAASILAGSTRLPDASPAMSSDPEAIGPVRGA